MVITVIGILIALLLPAVQAAREAARRLQCTNNLKQTALGCLLHERAQGYFPCGGWRYTWSGDPDRGFTRLQPGGWIYNILPYIEQQALHNLGQGTTLTQKKTAFMVLQQTPFAMLYCPTRRAATVYPFPSGYSPFNCNTISTSARSDYAANAGQANEDATNPVGRWDLPLSWTAGDPSIVDAPGFNQWPTQAQYATYTGVICCAMTVKLADITDGATNTYLLGEKYLNPDRYFDGQEYTDNNPICVGFDWDFERWSDQPPYQDTAGSSNYYCYGSAHATGFNMAFCDGSVQPMSYTIAAAAHACLGNRKDGNMIDGKSF